MQTKKEQILIIENDGVFGARVAEAIKSAGYPAVFLLKNAADGTKAIMDYLPHMVILDADLPAGDAYSVIARKHLETVLSKIPLFLISTKGLPIQMAKVPPGSVNEFLISTHVTAEQIVERIDAYFHYDRKEDAAPAGTQKKILWVEDDRLLGNILAKKFVSSGFELLHAKSGQEAVEMMQKATPDVIVLDLVLPGMSGFDILQALREQERFKNIPAMILSNLSKQSDIERAKTLGAQKFLVKASASLDQIIEEVKMLCK